MANCSICGDPCGLVSAHPDCEKRVSLGDSPEKVRADIILADGLNDNAGLYSSARAVRVLATIFFPMLILFGAIEGYVLPGTTDFNISSICAAFGALCDGLMAALIFNWFRMQALLARRIGEYLDSH